MCILCIERTPKIFCGTEDSSTVEANKHEKNAKDLGISVKLHGATIEKLSEIQISAEN